MSTPLTTIRSYIPNSAHQYHYFRKIVLQDAGSLKTWGIFALFVCGLFHFCSDGDFSFLLTLSSIVGAFGFLLVLYKIIRFHSVEGLSLKTLVLYCVVNISRLISVLFSDAYLPLDRSGDWVYRLTEAISTITVFALLLSMKYLKHTYNPYIDKFAGSSSHLSVFSMVSLLLCLLIYSEFVHPGLSQHHTIDVLWGFSHYVESIAVYPQLYLFSRSRKAEIEPFTSHFVFSLALSRLLTLLFWCTCWKELNYNTNTLGKVLAGRSILLSQFLQILIMGNYVFYYLKSYSLIFQLIISILTGTPLVLPMYRSSREE